MRQTLFTTLRQRAVVAGHIAFHQFTHFRGLRLPEPGNRLRGVQPGEKQVADLVLTLFDRELIRAEKTRALTVHRGNLISQQTQVILSVGIADSVTESALVLGTNVRHAETGPADIGTGLLRLAARVRRKTQPQKHTRQAQPG
ncbi:hypothetical protein D3C71_817470 [compost metagenome]